MTCNEFGFPKKPKFKTQIDEIRWFLDLPTCNFLQAIEAHHLGFCISRKGRNSDWRPVVMDEWKHEDHANKPTWEDILAKDWVVWEEKEDAKEMV